MELEKWQKIADITLKGVATIGIAGITAWLGFLRFDTDQTKLCTDMLDQTFQMVSTNNFSEQRKALLDWRIEQHGKICDPLQPEMVRKISNAWKPADKVVVASVTPAPTPAAADGTATPPARPARRVTGWVALSDKRYSTYQATNFDRVAGAEPLHQRGNVLMARWNVNIRANTSRTALGNNPVVAMLLGSECVRVTGHVSGQINEWAEIEKVACPPSATAA